jgi:hypothetical protein
LDLVREADYKIKIILYFASELDYEIKIILRKCVKIMKWKSVEKKLKYDLLSTTR